MSFQMNPLVWKSTFKFQYCSQWIISNPLVMHLLTNKQLDGLNILALF